MSEVFNQLQRFIGTDLYREVSIYALQDFRCRLTTGKPNAPKSYWGDGRTVEEAIDKALQKFRKKDESLGELER